MKYYTLQHTNGDVRISWIRENDHILALEPERARLQAEKRSLSARLRHINKRIKELA